jgi:hypothetical protein
VPAARCRRRSSRRLPIPTACGSSNSTRSTVDVITLRNATTQCAHTIKIHLPPIAPQYIIDGERVSLAAALQVRIVVMLCTAAQSIAIKVSVDDESVGELAPIRVESELSTALDFDQRCGAELAKGTNGVVFAGTWRGQPVAVKLLRQGGVLAARSRRPRGGGAPARSRTSYRLPRHFGRADALLPYDRAAPFGSLKSVLNRVGEREARAAVCLSAVPPLFCTRRRSCTRDIKAGQPARLHSRRAKPSSRS